MGPLLHALIMYSHLKVSLRCVDVRVVSMCVHVPCRIHYIAVVSSKFRVMWLCLDGGLDPQPTIPLSPAYSCVQTACHVIWFGWG
jgi:hypothetical protein